MIFPSYEFILVFLPLVLVFWLSKLPLRTRLVVLTISSYVFYGWWDYRFTTLLALSTVVDYFCGRHIGHDTGRFGRKTYLWISILSNLSILGIFKYCDFFIGNLNTLALVLHLESHIRLLHIVLPLGISFYTFQSMSYTIDIYRGNAKPAPDFMHFAAFVSLFPQLVAGPIVRYEMMAEQVRSLYGKKITSAELSYGAWFFIIGLVKKLWIADMVAPLSDRLFDGSGTVEFFSAWMGTLAYTVQLYFDFSGYSDMAIGLGLMLGFRFPVNFNSPYKARDISDFWNRWHITLSHFLRDYLFIPLGGSRGTVAKTLRNLLITMFLGGLWHGAQWTFVIWGLYHGVLLCVNALGRRLTSFRLHLVPAVAITFVAVVIGWVLFRAPTFGRVWQVYEGMAGVNGFETVSAIRFDRAHAIMAIGLCVSIFLPNSFQMKKRFNPFWSLLLAIVFVLSVLKLGVETPFIYFQF